jgi:phenylpropionate dioxygenase-like ring-hydroxylating dioxygenase large terminal subunit
MSLYLDILKKHWLPVCKSSELRKKPLNVKLLGEEIVLFRLKKGISAIRDRCPHRNVPLSRGRIIDDCIQCPYHGWKFDGLGICQEIPGSNPIEKCHPYQISAFIAEEKAGLIWIKLDSKSSYQIQIPEHTKNKAFNTQIWTDRIKGNLANALENFLDGTHTHYIHAGLLRSEKERKTITAEINPYLDRVEIIYKNESSQNGLISRIFEPERYESKARFMSPCIAELEYTDKNGVYFIVSAYLVPITESDLRVFTFMSHRNSVVPGLLKHLVIYPFFKIVLEQDKKILAIQQECIDRFNGESFIITKQDLIRPYIHRLLLGQEISSMPKSTILIYL